MRSKLPVICLLGLVLALAGLRAARADAAQPGAEARGATTQGGQQEPTPVIDPQPMPEPIFLPLTLRRYDPAAPGAIASTLEGYLASLSRTGRQSCWPATHALLDRPEGSAAARVRAVLRSQQAGINLDFYVGEHVEVEGVQDLAPLDCQVLTRWALAVDAIEIVPVPPGPTR